MAQITLGGNPIDTIGYLPTIGNPAPEFTLTDVDLSEKSLSDYKGKKVLLNIFPSLDTGICATSMRKFNEEASKMENTVVICISMDLPFAFKRFCTTEGLENVHTLSAFRDDSNFMENYGIKIMTGGMRGLCARSVVTLDEEGKVLYHELVPEIGQEPDYQSALNSL